MKVCKICWLSEDEHHEPYWQVMPDQCKCGPGGWDCDEVPSVCGHFVKSKSGNCFNCEHDEACHKDDQKIFITRQALNGDEIEYEATIEQGTRKEILIAVHRNDEDEVYSRYVDVETLIDFLGEE